MEFYTNNATVKRYERKRKRTTKDNKEKYTTYETVTVDLGNQSEFKHNQKVVIIANEDYAKLMEELNQKRANVQQFQHDTTDDPTLKNGNVTNDVTNQELKNQLLAMDNDRIKLNNVQRELDKYKSMAIDWNGQLLGIETIINRLIDEVIQTTKKYYDVEIDKAMEDNKRALQSLLKKAEEINQENLETYQKHNTVIAEDIVKTVEDTNEQIRNTSLWQMIRHKKDINLHVPTTDLMEAPQNVKQLALVDNAEVLEKLQSKPNFGNIDIAKLKRDLVNVPQLEALAVKSNDKK